MTIGDKIKELRLKNKLTQAQLAEKLFVSRQAITNYERNANRPDVEILKKLADIFDVNVEYFLDDVDKDDSLTEMEENNEEDIIINENTSKKKKSIIKKIIIITSSIITLIISTFVIVSICIFVEERNIKKNMVFDCGWYIEFNSDYIYSIEELEQSDIPYFIKKYNKEGSYLGSSSSDMHPGPNMYFSKEYDYICIYLIKYYPYYDKYEMIKDFEYKKNELSKDRYKFENGSIVYISPIVKEVSIVSYDKYDNVMREDIVFIDEDGVIKTTAERDYSNGFHSYNLIGAARYYVEYVDNDNVKHKFNIIEDTTLEIFMSNGDYRNNNGYNVSFSFIE